MTWIKICGITNLEDAQLAVNAGADALGFVFYEKSPRKVSVETARAIVAQLPERVEKVGVFVEQTAAEICKAVERVGLTAVQLHGENSPDFMPDRPIENQIGVEKLIMVLPGDRLAEGSFAISSKAKENLYAVLVDSGSGKTLGGTGKTFNWNETHGLVQAISLTVPVIVAGGLNPLNVGEAVRLFQPFGVDVASGTEARPGTKDPEKVRAFVEAVKRADKAA
jgi:phosphoribosylanthranilate isomerase